MMNLLYFNINGEIVNVRLAKLPLLEPATGSIQAVHETTISSKLPARVTELNIKAGQTVKQGEALLLLDDAEVQAKLQKAKSNVVMAEAAHAQAVAHYRQTVLAAFQGVEDQLAASRVLLIQQDLRRQASMTWE